MEVEVKFKVEGEIEDKVRKIAKFIKEKFEEDLYFSHPCRNFAETDEALRLRKDEEGFTLTYKGPKVEKETKSRHEVKLKVESYEKAKDLLEKIGFKPFAEVKKIRRIYRTDDGIIICLDDVFNLGKFLEIEVEGEIDKKEELFRIASILGYKREESIKKSYLEMLLELKSSSSKTYQS
ncbi:MAG: class IV adenylate cyclase [Archaeoglobaceae archaeon]|nr:class IV adenylate cyclase [Archaeoglobaceae archaeon]MDW8014008.1 class IV adenylate cyclase [Archaeoglobaceae archaeon]